MNFDLKAGLTGLTLNLFNGQHQVQDTLTLPDIQVLNKSRQKHNVQIFLDFLKTYFSTDSSSGEWIHVLRVVYHQLHLVAISWTVQDHKSPLSSKKMTHGGLQTQKTKQNI